MLVCERTVSSGFRDPLSGSLKYRNKRTGHDEAPGSLPGTQGGIAPCLDRLRQSRRQLSITRQPVQSLADRPRETLEALVFGAAEHARTKTPTSFCCTYDEVTGSRAKIAEQYLGSIDGPHRLQLLGLERLEHREQLL